ncbi:MULTISPECIES: TonB-dependent receptor [unclassified Methylobacterium]|jgi:iron complex outermembrane receptor protein|uniref:TonB-dependent receptor n=1 Tax=unclassified Methylobacterium TaxID=2615210 RepID=UPI001354C088|nr:TonB-dependent receptor [Methylobacterium sp. 2A]MWV22407.1 TonB-dependent receptor plug domain-containing protein [Methylobacterium sp. 2A]
MRYVGLVAILGAGTILAGPARAETAAPTVALDEISVTATRAPRRIEDVPQSVQVVDREQIRQQLALTPSPSAVLAKLVPGFSVPNGTISSASETFRGRNLLVLIDGVPVNTPLRDVSRILNLIDLNSVERIEVVAGASSLYSAGATGGTVNFITRRPTDGKPVVTVNTAVRTFTADPVHGIAPETSISVTGKVPDGIDYAFTGSGRFAGRTYDGKGREMPSDGQLGQGGGDRLQLGNINLRLGYDLDLAKRIEFGLTQILLNQDPRYLTDYTGAYARPNFARSYPGLPVAEDTRSLYLRYTDRDTPLGSLSLLGFFNDINKRTNYTEFAYPANPFVTYSFRPSAPTSLANQSALATERGGINLTLDTDLSVLLPGMKLTWGTDVIAESTRQRSRDGADVFTPLQQNSYAGFALLQLPVGERLTLRAGMRYEHFDLDVAGYTRPTTFAATAARNALGYSTFVLPAVAVTGGRFSYAAPTFNAGATFNLLPGIDLYGGFSQGYALADIGAFTRRAGLSLAYACPVTRPFCLPAGTTIAYSSIAPRAQIVNSYDFGIRGRVGIFSGSLGGFVSTSDEGTTFDPLTSRLSQQKEEIYGVEFTGNAQVTEQLSLGTVLGYREGRYDTNRDGRLDSYLPNNRIGAPFRATLSGTYLFENGVSFRLEGEGFTGRDARIDRVGTRYRLKDAFTVNASVGAPLAGGELYASVDNLFDATYWNPTATSVRNLTVYGLGRTVTVGYRKTF